MKMIKQTQLIAAIIGLCVAVGAASNDAATFQTLFIGATSVLTFMRIQIERNLTNNH